MTCWDRNSDDESTEQISVCAFCMCMCVYVYVATQGSDSEEERTGDRPNGKSGCLLQIRHGSG